MRIPRVRLSIRMMMVAVLLVGGGLGWVVQRARVQSQAVAAIVRAGGSASYSYEWGQYGRDPSGKPGLPRWLLDAVGPDYFYPVKHVQLFGGRADDALMEHVGRLSELEEVSLNGSKAVTDAGIAHLAGLRSLKELDLQNTRVTGACLAHLAGMTQLETLRLSQHPGGQIFDADLAHVERLAALKTLQIGGIHAGISDAGLRHLTGLARLETLWLASPNITRDGLGTLRPLKQLRDLNLANCSITDLTPIRDMTWITSLSLRADPIGDAGLASIGSLPALDSLDLGGTKITDAGLAHLRGCKGLTRLNLDFTEITDAGLADLRGFKGMTHLDLEATRITDAGLAHIAGLTKMQSLHLDKTQVGDGGLPQLAGLNQMMLLFVEGTEVTDAGIAGLAGMKQCTQVAIGKTAVTDAGIAAAQQYRPGTRFVRMGP